MEKLRDALALIATCLTMYEELGGEPLLAPWSAELDDALRGLADGVMWIEGETEVEFWGSEKGETDDGTWPFSWRVHLVREEQMLHACSICKHNPVTNRAHLELIADGEAGECDACIAADAASERESLAGAESGAGAETLGEAWALRNGWQD